MNKVVNVVVATVAFVSGMSMADTKAQDRISRINQHVAEYVTVQQRLTMQHDINYGWANYMLIKDQRGT